MGGGERLRRVWGIRCPGGVGSLTATLYPRGTDTDNDGSLEVRGEDLFVVVVRSSRPPLTREFSRSAEDVTSRMLLTALSYPTARTSAVPPVSRPARLAAWLPEGYRRRRRCRGGDGNRTRKVRLMRPA